MFSSPKVVISGLSNCLSYKIHLVLKNKTNKLAQLFLDYKKNSIYLENGAGLWIANIDNNGDIILN